MRDRPVRHLTESTKRMTQQSRLLFFLAGVCAFSVANIYYNQPLLVLFAHSFGTDVGAASVIAMAVQLAYAAGLVLLVPLGDILSRRTLVLALLLANALSSALAACAGSLPLLVAANIAIGLSSVSAQVIIPAVSLMSAPAQRGKAVGTVMSGLVAGILMARTLSGYVGHAAGWRNMYWLAAAIDAALLLAVAARFPRNDRQPAATPYPALLRSLGQLFLGERELRLACLCGALMFASFSALWGSMAYLLSLPPYRYSSDVAGAFGLAGVAGMFATPLLGRLADRLGARSVVLLSGLACAAAYALVGAAPQQLGALVTGVVVLDLGGRAGLLGNQLRALALSEAARSRLNTVFMACYFLGGALGTRAGAYLGMRYGWHGVALMGLATSAAVIALNGSAAGALRRRFS
jgi:predicted MFS family arabinose efflux permease